MPQIRSSFTPSLMARRSSGTIKDLKTWPPNGVLEIVLFGRYYEGDWVTAYRVDGDKIIKIFSAGCGV